mgnify:CR=1 FL=1|jgi:hypothetical protein
MATDTITRNQLLVKLHNWFEKQNHEFLSSTNLINIEPCNRLYDVRILMAEIDSEGLFQHSVSGEVEPTKDEEITEPIETKSETTEGKKKKKQRDPNAPKRPLTPYMNWLWSDVGIAKVKKDNHGIKHKAAMSKAGDIWKVMNETEKEPWKSISAEQRADYNAAINSYIAPKHTETQNTMESYFEAEPNSHIPYSEFMDFLNRNNFKVKKTKAANIIYKHLGIEKGQGRWNMKNGGRGLMGVKFK